jgi:hypothetical protein
MRLSPSIAVVPLPGAVFFRSMRDGCSVTLPSLRHGAPYGLSGARVELARRAVRIAVCIGQAAARKRPFQIIDSHRPDSRFHLVNSQTASIKPRTYATWYDHMVYKKIELVLYACVGTVLAEVAPGGDRTVLPNGIYDSLGAAVALSPGDAPGPARETRPRPEGARRAAPIQPQDQVDRLKRWRRALISV